MKDIPKWRPGTRGPMPEGIPDKISERNKGKHGMARTEEWKEKIREGKSRNAKLRRTTLPQ